MSRHEAGEACRSQSVRVSCSFCSHRNGWGSCVLPQRRHEVIVPKIEQAAAEEPRPPRPGRTLLCLGTCTCDFGTTAWSPRCAHIWVTPFTSCAAPSRVAFLRGKPALGTCVWAPLWLVRLRGCPPGHPSVLQVRFGTQLTCPTSHPMPGPGISRFTVQLGETPKAPFIGRS